MAIPICSLSDYYSLELENLRKAFAERIQEVYADKPIFGLLRRPEWLEEDDRFTFDCEAAITRCVHDYQTGEDYVVDICIGTAAEYGFIVEDLMLLTSTQVMTLGAADALDELCEWARQNGPQPGWVGAISPAARLRELQDTYLNDAIDRPTDLAAPSAACYYCGKTVGSDACRKAHS